MPSFRSCALLSVGMALVACAAASSPAVANGPASLKEGDGGFDAAKEAAEGVSTDAAAADAAAADAPAVAGAWRVETRKKGTPGPLVETWPTFAHQWQNSEPFDVSGEQRLCLPKGRYVLDLATSPSLHTDVTVDGALVMKQRDFPSEISPPLAFDGCKTVRVHLQTPFVWRQASVSLVVRPAVDAEPCDTHAFPKDAWNMCMFHGRNQEEPIGNARQAKLESPKNQAPGRLGDFDWYSVEARRTVCFDRGDYVFHGKLGESLRVDVGERTVLDGADSYAIHVAESKPTPLSGCVPITVKHAYRYGHSVLELAWARAGSALDRAWAIERACSFSCDGESVCTSTTSLRLEGSASHVCVPTKRLSHLGEYCDDKHRCDRASGFCVRNRCFED